ncbi:MAG: HlyD family efflux transporter periplasmic adaptor subunit [Tannerellaceae bacterium]|jgi:HlyD family secretion protein|nr:HlyD family efflux transporter periplasmic adaptor subunit [Tannerellaceae bacterium]
MMFKNCFSFVILPAACFLTSCAGGRDGASDATGAFEATEVVVSSEAGGRIMEFTIQEGNSLEAGHYAGYVDTAQLYLRKMQLTAALKAAGVRKPDVHKQIAATEQQISAALIERSRMEGLVQAGAGNTKQLDDVMNMIRLLEKQLDAQRSSLDKTSESVDAEAESLLYQVMQLDDMLQKSRIVNPVRGVVLAKYAEQGEVTAVGRPLYKIADVSTLYLRAYITAAQLSQLKQGQQVRVYADYGPDQRHEYPGALTWVSDKSEFTPKGIQTRDERSALVYAVKIAVKNDGFLKIGQYGEVIFGEGDE